MQLEFNRENYVWKFIDYIKSKAEPIDKLFKSIKSLLQTEKKFEGTASELLLKLCSIDNTIEIKPNAMTRVFNENSLTLKNQFDICYKSKRTAQKRLINLSLLDGDDDV